MLSFYRFLLAILLAAYACVLIRAKRRAAGLTPLLGWLMGLGFFLLIPMAIITICGGYEMPPSDGWTEAWTKVNLANPLFFRPYLLVWLSMMLTCLTVFLLTPASAAQKSGMSVSLPRLERALRITMALSAVDWIVNVWLVGGLAEFAVSHWYLRSEVLSERFGGSFILYTHLSQANQLIFTGAAALHLSLGLRERNVRWNFTPWIALFLLMEMAMSGNRIYIAFYLLAFLASSWLYGRRKLVLSLLVSAPLLVALFSAWGLVRHDLSKLPDSVTADVMEANTGGRALSSLMYATEAHAVLLMLHVVNDFGGKYDYLHGATYGRLLTFWLPRRVYPHRPLDFSNQLAMFYLPGETTSLCAGAFGEAYANFGLASLAVYPVFTLLVIWYGTYIKLGPQGRPLLSAVSFLVMIWFARCTFAENVFNLVGAAALIWVLKLEVDLRSPPIPVPE